MTPEQFIKIYVVDGIELLSDEHRRFAEDARNAAVDAYSKHKFESVHDLVMDHRIKLKERICMHDSCTIKEYASALGLSYSTARKKLQKKVADKMVRVNRKKRPYKFAFML